MNRIALAIVAAAIAIAGWGALILVGHENGWGRTPLAARGDAQAFAAAAISEIARAEPGNVAFVLIDDGVVVAEHYASRGTAVDRDTQFQVASLSKWATAVGVMTLVENGTLDLDAPVSRYLKRWSLPPGAFDNDGVTIRRLLSHTAGLTDGLGFGGFAPGEAVQSLPDALTRASDASPGADGRVQVGAEPGAAWAYSGGGYALLQLVVEDVTNAPFDEFMTKAVFAPLGMSRSTFSSENLSGDVAASYAADKSEAVLYEFSAPSAAGLYTTAADMTRFVQMHFDGPNGEAAGRGVLRPESLAAMRAPEAARFGVPIWGLGPILYAADGRGSFVIGHDGANEPAINTTARLDPDRKSGIVILETGDKRLATTLGGQWVFWKAGKVDILTFLAEFKTVMIAFGAGAALIFVGALALLFAKRRKQAFS